MEETRGPRRPLPLTADVVRLRPLAQVAGQLINGEKSSEHDVTGQREETSGDVAEPFWGSVRPEARRDPAAEEQQGNRAEHDGVTLTEVCVSVCVCVRVKQLMLL